MRYTLTFGRTKRPAEYESVHAEYTQEYDDEDMPREAAWEDLRAFVYRKLEEEMSEQMEREVEAAPPTAKAKVEPKKETTEAQEEVHALRATGVPMEYYYPKVEALEWRAFKEKRPAGSDEAAWIFSNTPGAENLVDVVRREGAVYVRMGGRRFLCKLSVGEGQFLQRIPQEKEGSKK